MSDKPLAIYVAVVLYNMVPVITLWWQQCCFITILETEQRLTGYTVFSLLFWCLQRKPSILLLAWSKGAHWGKINIKTNLRGGFKKRNYKFWYYSHWTNYRTTRWILNRKIILPVCFFCFFFLSQRVYV